MIAVSTEDALASLVSAIQAGLANSVLLSCVTPVVVTMVSVKMALVSVCLVGTVDIAHWRAVREDVPDTDSAKLQMTVSGPANALMDGMDRIVQRSKNKSATMAKIMTKVCIASMKLQDCTKKTKLK